MLRALLLVAAALSAATAVAAPPSAANLSEAPDGYEWRPMRTGAGGFIVGIDVHQGGRAIYARADTGGAFRLDRQRRPLAWEQIVTSASMPQGSMRGFDYLGVTAIASAPSNERRVYMVWPDSSGIGRAYRSDDGGAHWIRTALALDGEAEGPNGIGRTQGERLAVDPRNPDRVTYGSLAHGLWTSRDAGAHWRRIAAVPDSAEQVYGTANVRIVRMGASKAAIYATVYRKGIFRSADDGRTWVNISGPGGPPPGSYVQQMAVDGAGTVYAAAEGRLYVRRSQRWSQAVVPSRFEAYNLAVDPVRAGHVIVFGGAGRSVVSQDFGAHFSDPALPERAHADIPWQGWIDEHFTISNLAFDPANPGRLWVAQGIGVWTAVPGASGPIRWEGVSHGIEQLVSTAIAAPPGGPVITGSWDRALFVHSDPEAYPAQSGPTKRFNSAWDIAYAARRPAILAAVVDDHRQCCSAWDGPDNQSGISQDGGRSWTPFAAIASGTLPKALTFGNIAISASDTANLVWVPTNNGRPHFTRDGGASWQPARFVNAQGAVRDATPFHAHFYLVRSILVADALSDHRFTLFDGSTRMLYRSDDGGETWRAKGAPLAGGDYSADAVLRAAPGRSGHFCVSNGGAAPLMCTLDDGANWQALPGTEKVVNFAFGAPARPGREPTLYLQGFVSGGPGIWCSGNLGKSWGRLAQFPLGMSAPWRAMDADQEVFGKVYGGTAGNGFIYGQLKRGSGATLCGGAVE